MSAMRWLLLAACVIFVAFPLFTKRSDKKEKKG